VGVILFGIQEMTSAWQTNSKIQFLPLSSPATLCRSCKRNRLKS